VLEFKLSITGTGYTKLYLNGTLVESIVDLNTVESPGSVVVTRIEMGGTIAQPAYDSPAHYRKFDDLILTDSADDVSSYLGESEPEVPANAIQGVSISNLGITNNLIAWHRTDGLR